MSRPPALPALTSLRFFAALIVVIYHTGAAALEGLPAFAQRALGIGTGFVGVNLFFALSGFILAYVYLNGRPVDRPRFWQARVARIYPLYLLGLVVAMPFYVLDVMQGEFSPLPAILAPLLLQSWFSGLEMQWNGPGWSLSVEAFFYAAFPFLALWLARVSGRAALWGMLGAWLLALLPSTLWQLSMDPADVPANWMLFNPLVHLPTFLMGAFGAQVYRDYSLPRAGMWAGLASAAVLGILATGAAPHLVLHNGLLLPLFMLLIVSLANVRSGALHHPRLQLLGEASYSLYLLHFPLWGWLQAGAGLIGVDVLRGPAYVLALLFLVGVSIAAFRLIEVPARRWISSRFLAARAQPVS